MRYILLLVVLLCLTSCNEDKTRTSIKVSGKMSEVMWQGQLKGQIATDSLNTKNAYGLGPLEFLKGEILLIEGQTFISKVVDSITHEVVMVPSAKAPFFVYTANSDLRAIQLVTNEYNLQDIEAQIEALFSTYKEPLLVRIDGLFKTVKVHSVNLPDGAAVASPAEAHQGLTTYDYHNIQGTIVGFFSRHHQSVFTHHDSFFHAHFISDDRKVLGHVDETHFNSSKVSLKVSN